MRPLAALTLPLTLAACSDPEPRSSTYFEAHPAEAKSVIARCQRGSQRNAECETAATAVHTLNGKDRFRRFRGKD